MSTHIERVEDTRHPTMALGYVRVAATSQMGLPMSAQDQLEAIMNYCHSHDIRLAGFFQDLGVSGHAVAPDGLRHGCSERPVEVGEAQVVANGEAAAPLRAPVLRMSLPGLMMGHVDHVPRTGLHIVDVE